VIYVESWDDGPAMLASRRRLSRMSLGSQVVEATRDLVELVAKRSRMSLAAPGRGTRCGG